MQIFHRKKILNAEILKMFQGTKAIYFKEIHQLEIRYSCFKHKIFFFIIVNS